MTDEQSAADRHFDEAPLTRITGAVYWLVMVTMLLALTALPTVVIVFLLDRSASNLPYVALAAIPLGPALSAALYATRARAGADDLTPARSFWHGYRINWADVLKVWAPALVVLGVIGYVLTNVTAAGLSEVYVAVLTGIAALVAVWVMHATAISSFFGFRAGDVARLSLYYLVRKPGASFGVLALLVVALGIVWFTSDVVLVVLGGIWVGLWYRIVLPMLDDVRERFTDVAPAAEG
jgi:uncharacterized membrane protein YesL